MDKLILFGSYARGNPDEYSDIDVAVLVEKTKLDFFEVNAILWGLRMDIDTLIEPIYFEKGDPDPSGFLADILAHGEVIWEA